MYAMKTITTRINPLYKPRLSWVSFHSTQFRKFRLVHQIGTGHFGKNCRYPVPLFCILPTRTKTKREVVWFRAVQPKCTVPLCTWNVRTFKPLNCSALVICLTWRDRGLERLRLIACVQTPIFVFDEEGRGAVCTQATALTIVKKGIGL